MARKNDGRKPYKTILWTVVSLFLAVFTIRTVLNASRTVSINDLVQTASEADRLYLLAAVLCTALYVWLEGEAVCAILDGIGFRKPHRRGLLYSAADIYFSAVTPSATGGQPASAFFMIRDGIPAGTASAALILNLMMYTVSIILLGILSLVIVPGAVSGFGGVSATLIICGFAVLTGLAFFFYLMLKKGGRIFVLLSGLIRFLHAKGLLRRKERVAARLDKAREDYKNCAKLMKGKRRMILKVLALNVLQRAAQISVPVWLFLALGGHAGNAPGVFAKQCLTTIGYNFVPVPGAMGVADYLMVDAFNGFMGSEEAFSLELLSRGLTFYLCVLVCGAVTLTGYVLKRSKHDRSI